MTRYRIEVEQLASATLEVESADLGLSGDTSAERVAAEVVRGINEGDPVPDWQWSRAQWVEVQALDHPSPPAVSEPAITPAGLGRITTQTLGGPTAQIVPANRAAVIEAEARYARGERPNLPAIAAGDEPGRVIIAAGDPRYCWNPFPHDRSFLR
jgi:hypothetical protein